jgi:hypothetical protein
MRDFGKWVVIALCLIVAASEIFVVRQNWQLRQRVSAANAVSSKINYLRSKSEQTLYEASMTGRCRPFFDSAAAAPGRPLDVAIYFSLHRDCMSCVEDVVGQWNAALKSPTAKGFNVRGYTDIDGTRAQRTIDRDLKPAFPVTSIEHIEDKLAAAGITSTPVVFVSDPATGRILLSSAPLVGERGDRSLIERLHAVITPCR